MSEHKRKKRMDRAPEPKADLEKLKSAKIPERRVRMFMVEPGQFMFMFTKGLEFAKRTKIVEGLPEDAKFISIAADSGRLGIMLVVESSEFELIPITQLPPIIPWKIEVGVPSATKKLKRKKK